MPKIEQTHNIEISAERFLNACSPGELFDVNRLIRQRRYQDKIEEMMTGVISEHAEEVPGYDIAPLTDQLSPALAQVAGKAISKYCANCNKPKFVVLYAGRPTCDDCIANLKANH